MTAKNDVTGDPLVTKITTDKYRDGWERIFGQEVSRVKMTEEVERDPAKLVSEQVLKG